MKFILKNTKLLSLFVIFPALLQAQQVDKNLQLTEAISLGLQNSKTLKESDAKIEKATAILDESRNNRLPDLNVSGAYLYLAKPNINLHTNNNSSSDSSSSSSSFPNVHQALYGMLNASLPIYAGGKITNGIKSAQYLENATKLDAQGDKEMVAQNIINSYYNLYKAEATLKLVKENLLNAEQRVKDFKSLEANGIIARNDLMKVELQQSNMELTLLDAENNKNISNFNFNLLLGLPDSTNIIIDSSSVYNTPDVPTVAELSSMAKSNRFDYLATIERLNSAEYDTKVIKGNALPSIALTGGYISAYVPNFVTAYNIINIGVGVKYDIGSLYKNGAKLRQARTQEKILQIQQEKLQDDIQTEIFEAYNNYLHTKKKIDVYKTAIEQSEENYRITKNKYNNSLATATDLLDADVANLQAKINMEAARADAAVAYNKVFETVGVLNKQINKTNN